MDELKIVIKPIEKYEVTIAGELVGEFELESSWEGMIKLKGDDGGTIIAEDERSLVTKAFLGVFGKDEENYFNVLKISPSLIRVPKD